MKLKDLPTKYDFKSVEKGKYRTWVERQVIYQINHIVSLFLLLM